MNNILKQAKIPLHLDKNEKAENENPHYVCLD